MEGESELLDWRRNQWVRISDEGEQEGGNEHENCNFLRFFEFWRREIYGVDFEFSGILKGIWVKFCYSNFFWNGSEI